MDPSEFTAREIEDFKLVLAELAGRRKEALALFAPMASQEEFLACEAAERIVLGGNRGGKTLITSVEFARAVTGQDPHDKYPRAGGRAIVCGKDLLHCSKVIYRKLFKPGAFQIIKDAETGDWRAFRPSDPADLARIDEARPAPPLIPRRFYDPKKISWENKKEEIPKTIPLKNGWEITFFSSIGAPPQGWDIDLCLFDEEIDHPLWYPEMAARLLDRRQVDQRTGRVRGGKFIWSATPQAGTLQLYELKCRADELAEDDDAPIRCFCLTLLDNSYMSQSAKDEFIGKIGANEDEYRIRVLGDFALLGSKVYPELMPKGVHAFRGPDGKPASFPIPADWMRACAIDPGRQVCAVLFVAIPPPSSPFAGRKFLYDELYIKKCTAAIFAEHMRRKLVNQVIHRWVIDHRAGRIPEMGSGKTHEQQYSDALRRLDVKCETTQFGFTWSTASGADNVKAGIEAVRQGLAVDRDGNSEWVLLTPSLPHFCEEADKYAYKKLPNGMVTDEPVKVRDHLMDCWRYLAMANLKYARPRPKKRVGYTNEALKRKRDRARSKSSAGWDGSIKLG